MAERLTREEKKAQTRRRLLEAATEVFARRGFVAASLDEVAEEAGLTKGAVYSNFENKEDLVLAVLYETSGRLIREAVAQVDVSGTIDEKARRAGSHFMRTTQHRRPLDLLMLEHIAYAARNPNFHQRSVALHRRELEKIADIIERTASEFGLTLPVPPDQMAVLMNALGMGLAMEKLQDPERVPDELFGAAIGLIYGTAQTSGTIPS